MTRIHLNLVKAMLSLESTNSIPCLVSESLGINSTPKQLVTYRVKDFVSGSLLIESHASGDNTPVDWIQLRVGRGI